jgi:hypothetical protein
VPVFTTGVASWSQYSATSKLRAEVVVFLVAAVASKFVR